LVVGQKLHPNYEGSGVGIAIVRRVVEKHGGKLWALSTPRQGATLIFQSPGDIGADPQMTGEAGTC
jgi:signal transduction histidine kinase